MQAVLNNLVSTAELLAVARHSGAVVQWDGRTLCRAFQWASYCERVFSRFHSNISIRGALEEQLQVANDNLRAVFLHYTDVSFSDLSRCQYLLLTGLLNNPNVPIAILKILFDTTGPVDIEHGQYQDVRGMCSHVTQCVSACKILGPLTDVSSVGADAEVQGEILMERLCVLLSQGNEACQTQQFLDSVLQECKEAVGPFCLVLAAALLSDKPSDAAPLDFLLRWLKLKHTLLQRMCSALPAPLLKALARRHLMFRDAYCSVLKKWATDLEFSTSDNDWVHSGTNPTVSFRRLSEHFLDLFEACPALRTTVETELNALKISDGDFDVRGLSVWGDLLSEIHKCRP